MKIRRAPLLKRIPRSVIWAIVGVALLLGLMVGAGAAYIWYVGKNTSKDSAAFADPVQIKQAPIAKPTKPAANAPVGVAVHALTTPITPGSNASITVQTTPEVQCVISVEYNKIASTDSGLVVKTADEYGVVTWSWTVEPAVPLGKWPVNVTCTSDAGKSGMVRGELEVVKS